MEEKFYQATKDGNVEEVKEILRNKPNLNVNWKNEKEYLGTTALNWACHNGHDSIVFILLAHPDIDVNKKNGYGSTPFWIACLLGRTSAVRLLLKVSRVKVNEPRLDGSTPLWCAAANGHLDLIKWWITSRREMDLGQPGNEKTDALGVAKNPVMHPWESKEGFEERKKRCTKVATLLERFKENASKTRSEVRMVLGIIGQSICLFQNWIDLGVEELLSYSSIF